MTSRRHYDHHQSHPNAAVSTAAKNEASTTSRRSSCPCTAYPLERISELISSSSSANDDNDKDDAVAFNELLDWIRHGPKHNNNATPCQAKGRRGGGGCRLDTARAVLQAIRASFPLSTEDDETMNVAAATAAANNNKNVVPTTNSSSSTSSAATVAPAAATILDTTTTDAFPPLSAALASIKHMTTNTLPTRKKSTKDNTCLPTSSTAAAANSFPPLGSTPTAAATAAAAATPNTTKKGKRRIRPAVVSTTPLSSNTTNSNNNASNVWGQPTTAEAVAAPSAWPKPIHHHTNNNHLLEQRFSNASAMKLKTTTAIDNAQQPLANTPTKKKGTDSNPIVTVTPEKQERLHHQQRAATAAHQDSHLPAPLVSAEELELWQKDPPMAVRRLVDLYTAIVNALLVHSTPNQIRFCLRLLHNATTRPIWKVPENAPFQLFTTAKTKDNDDKEFRRCSVQFCSLLLTEKWSQRLIRWGFASHLLECPPIQWYCPDLYQQIQEYFVHHDTQQQQHPTISKTRTTALWTLPFNEMRDSRNRYRTTTEMALYKNREETRDAFLSHLRAFYKQGSSLQQLNNTGSSQSAEKVRSAARSVLDPLWDDNVPWLAEFFVDMLLQLGCVPVQETDAQVLQMADQEKVQKLHQRFNAPAARKGRSGGANHKKPSPVLQEGSRTTMVQEEFFRGHQEFFYYFVMLADSHKLNHHLRHQFLEKIHLFSSNCSLQNLDKSLEDLCLLGRFLGLLVFSPNWNSSKVVLDESRSRSLVYDELGFLRFGSAGLIGFVLDAWKLCRLITVIPWLVEMLRMSVWDDVSRRTKTFQQLTQILRQMQGKLIVIDEQQQHRASRNCQEILFLCLECFVDEVAGLDWVEETSLQNKENLLTWDEDVENRTTGLDSEVKFIERGTVFAFSSRTETLLDVVSDLTRSSRGLARSPGISRKVRPSVVVLSSSETTIKATKVTAQPLTERQKLETELRESFFHLQRDLLCICDFTAERALQLATEEWKSIEMETLLVGMPDDSVDWSATEKALAIKCEESTKAQLQQCLSQSINLFAPTLHPQVKQTAITLSVDQGLRAGRPRIDLMVRETTRLYQTKLRKKKLSSKFDEIATASKISAVIPCLDMLAELIDTKGQESNPQMVLEVIGKTGSALDSWTQSFENPPEEDLRSFYSAIARLDTCCLTFLPSLFRAERSEQDDWLVLSALLHMAAKTCRVCSFGLRSIKSALANAENIDYLLVMGKTHGKELELKRLVEELCQSRLIPARQRREVLAQVHVQSPPA